MGRHRRHDAGLQPDHGQRRRSRTSASIAAGAPGASRRRRSAGKRMAETVATGRVPELHQAVRLERFEIPAGQRKGRGGGGPLGRMKLISCPLNGPRNIDEFVWGGEVKAMLDPMPSRDPRLGRHVFIENNARAWCGSGGATCRPTIWFIAERNTVTDEIIRTFPRRGLQSARRFRRPRERRSDGGMNRLPGSLGPADRPAPAHTLHLRRRDVRGFAGDTVASALAANGQWVLSRSFKYRRPRGVARPWPGRRPTRWCRSAPSPTCWRTGAPIEPGLRRHGAERQRLAGARPRPDHRLFGRFLPVGFYYRAFFRRMAAGNSGSRSSAARPAWASSTPRRITAISTRQYLFADVAVVGGGPAGLSAALAGCRERAPKSC